VFLAGSSAHTSQHYLRLLELVRERAITAITPTNAPRKIALGSVVLTVFPDAPEDSTEENNNSVGVRLQYGAFSMLLPGDAEEYERAWWEEHVPELCAGCTVLKVAHHGSRNGTDARWLGLVKPKLAVASLGRNNDYGHPHPETVALLARLGIPLLRTDEAGTVQIVSDGQRWQVTRAANTARGPPAEVKARARRDKTPAHEAQGGQVELNTATQAELESLPGIGPVLARRIIEARPFRSVDDLDRVKGIGPKKLGEFRPLVRVE
jgi:predicted flap endonuclease-1-like 5' DNA nuclease